MKKKAKIILGIIIVIVLAAVGAVYMMLPAEVDTLTLTPGPANLTFTEQGVSAYRQSYTVYPLVAGEVLEVRVAEGQRVRPGDVLAVIDASDYRHQITQLESAIQGYNGQIANLWLQDQQRKAELAGALSGLEGQMTALDAEMAKSAEGNGSLQAQIEIQQMIVNQNEYHVRLMRDALEDAKDTEDDYTINLARQGLNTARNALSQSELLLEQLLSGEVPQGIYEGQKQSLQAQMDTINLQLGQNYTSGMQQYYNAQIAATQASIWQMEEKSGQAEVTASVGGIISKLPVGEQNLVSQQTPVALIGDDPFVEVFVPVREIDGISVGDGVELELDKRTGKEILSGTIAEIASEADIKLSALGVEERKVRVRIRPESELPIGYEMDVRFTVASWDSVLVAPKAAVFSRDGADWVWVLESGVIQARQITKGAETRSGYLVDGDLSAGDVVITDANDADIAEGKKAKSAA